MSQTEKKPVDLSKALGTAAKGYESEERQANLGPGDLEEARKRGLSPEIFRKAYDMKSMG